jgi:hypothetical protein
LFNSPSALAAYASALFQGFIVCTTQPCPRLSPDVIPFRSSSVRFITSPSILPPSYSKDQPKPA